MVGLSDKIRETVLTTGLPSIHRSLPHFVVGEHMVYIDKVFSSLIDLINRVIIRIRIPVLARSARILRYKPPACGS